jgi:hypothetical protein
LRDAGGVVGLGESLDRDEIGAKKKAALLKRAQ